MSRTWYALDFDGETVRGFATRRIRDRWVAAFWGREALTAREARDRFGEWRDSLGYWHGF